MEKRDERRKPYSVATIATMFDLTPGAIYRYCVRGIIPHYKVGRHIRFDPAIIDAFIASGGMSDVESASAAGAPS